MLRRPILLFLFFTLMSLTLGGSARAEEPLWTWLKGEMAPDDQPIYGTMGVASPMNRPGLRSGAASWVDASGRIWLFGGYLKDGRASDLWRFDPASGLWTWIKGSQTPDAKGIYGAQGVGAPINNPGARGGAVTWRDAAGRLWLFGGYGYDAEGILGTLSDLWRFDPASGKWTWVKGGKGHNVAGVFGTQGVAAASNLPGARSGAVAWTDSHNQLWLFGGYNWYYSSSTFYLNDLWRFDPAAETWTWVKGSNTSNQASVYGTQGVAAPENTPGARLGSVTWTDSAGRLWLFGGGTEYFYRYNDLWRFDPASAQWTWVKGSSTYAQPGVYGARGVAAAANAPGARSSAASWMDASGRLWLFGGYGYDSAKEDGLLADLWRYDPSTGHWTWVAGSDVKNVHGVYGSQGVAAPANAPGARNGGITWRDGAGGLNLYGGGGFGASGSEATLNDHWRFDVASGEWTWLAGSDSPAQGGRFGSVGIADPANNPPARFGAVSWRDNAGRLWLFGGAEDGPGYGSVYDVARNDLWLLKPSRTGGEWTWMKGSQGLKRPGVYGTQGVAGPTNTPGARRRAAGAVDVYGRLWLFGGGGVGAAADDVGPLNDLWRFDPGSSSWLWIKGGKVANMNGDYGSQGIGAPDNAPGGRYGSALWFDRHGRLWLFGGYGFDYQGLQEGLLNDLWRYDPATGAWTWIKGSKTINQRGAYGVKGTAAAGNTPGGRCAAAYWTDAGGRLWLFGGAGITAAGQGFMNDLWRLDPDKGEWIWVAGGEALDQASVYGEQGTPSPASAPGGRRYAAAWVDKSRRLWLYGGYGVISGKTFGSLDDLWRFDPATGQWTWIRGNNDYTRRFSVFGFPGVAAPENTPGPLESATVWADASSERLWLFGGQGCNAAGDWGSLGSLWLLKFGGPNAIGREAWERFE